MLAKLTPAPWLIYEFSGFGPEIYHTAPNKPIAHVFNMADARLMAAAPDLLAALENLLQWANEQDCSHSMLAVQLRMESLSAIAKAKGESR